MYSATNWNKTLANQDAYESSWEWTVAHSEYHFDKNIIDKPGDWYDIIGRFEGDWKEESDRLIENSKPINWQTRKYFGDTDKESPMLVQEEYDIAKGGGKPKDLLLTNIVDDWDDFPKLYSMMDFFGMEGKRGAKKRAHVHLTGQMFNYHIDKLWDRCPKDPERVARITIMLEDWQPGQFYMYGNHVYSHWKAGEAHIFDWPNVPHATSNASSYPRPTLQITGLKTDRTREILANGHKDKILATV